MTNEGQQKTTIPHLYIDTNVFARTLEGEHKSSIHLLETIREKGWRCSTSFFTSMELSEIRKEYKFIYNQLGLGIPIRKILRSLDQKDLSINDLRNAQDKIDILFSKGYRFVKFYWLEKAGWDRSVDLCATTNISPTDCIHLATAIEAGCDVLVTLDTFFKQEAQHYIFSCTPEEVNKTLSELKFAV